ncbi:MAG: hypothetical protein JST54_30510 [Deltaproteobacteria bacterium]|nr:hypothetical protein [Deltaproteobacteria bacterium]
MWHWLPLLGPLFDETPVTEGNYQEAEWFTPLMQINDRFGFILWPTLGLLVIGAIVMAVLKSATHKTIPGEDRLRVKKEIVQELRRKLHGQSLEELCKLVGHAPGPLTELVDEMVKDGMIKRDVNSKGAQLFKLPGM